MQRTLEPYLEYAEHRFPERLPLIRTEYERSRSFRALCEDLHVCAQALSRWEQSPSATAPERRLEYAQCLQELEQEIEEWLERAEITDS